MIDRGTGTKTLNEVKSVENIRIPRESSKFALHRARMPGEFNSEKDSHQVKFERRPRVLEKISFRKLRDSKLSG